MKKITFAFAAALLLAVGVVETRAAPSSSAVVKSAPRATAKPSVKPPRKAAPRKTPIRRYIAPRKYVARQAKIAGAPPITARRSPQTRRLLAIEYVRQASVAYRRGDYKRALALCETASEWYPTYARAHIWKGAAHQKLGQYAQAKRAYTWGRALSPDSADAARADRGLKELGHF